MRHLLTCVLSLLTFISYSQKKIDLKDVSKHVGDSITVEGNIFGVKTFPDNKQAPTLLNLGADFPKQLLTIAVFPSYQSEVIVMPTEGDKGAKAVVTGKIELYKGQPQIVVRSTSQLKLIAIEPVISSKD